MGDETLLKRNVREIEDEILDFIKLDDEMVTGNEKLIEKRNAIIVLLQNYHQQSQADKKTLRDYAYRHCKDISKLFASQDEITEHIGSCLDKAIFEHKDKVV